MGSSATFPGRLLLSGGFLVLANLVPLAGALAWGWSVLEIVAVYWAENLVIGGFTVLRILGVRPPDHNGVQIAANLIAAGFFTVHYGLFCAVHGIFVFSLLGGEGAAARLPGAGTALALLALLVSHGFSYVRNYLARGLYRETTVQAQMFAPYPRIVVLHLTILFGAFAIQAAGSPTLLLVILVVGKTILDLGLHWRVHRDRGFGPSSGRM